MMTTSTRSFTRLFIPLALLLVAAAALAQTGNGYDLTWWTVDGGGATLSGGGYTLTGTTGQSDAGAILTGGGYALSGGFWSGAAAAPPPPSAKAYLPTILK